MWERRETIVLLKCKCQTVGKYVWNFIGYFNVLVSKRNDGGTLS